ncbi:ribosomal protein uL16 3-hydroxylase [Vibrio gangliei]|uniref:ribosomal protein uL16 3-hydroxylase n=1 Tax=Vibrio gangliei TaxID=2077090 RepID=UPI000D01344A|nr:cupin domain-containing protein [Vibrio gangliei]
MYQLSFSLEQFLAEYWQKKPTVIKGGFFIQSPEQGFIDPLSPDELAGLAMEEVVDSRFVSNKNQQWRAEHGPFAEDKFADLPESHWSLIVQAANHWHPEVAQLVSPFQSMPSWLFDDVMISFAVEHGGVGPHIDQYDVFICQGMGKRHWRVGAKDEGQYEEVIQAQALRQIKQFDAIIDEVLEPGDILYIPPGFPHDGYALEPSMSYSVGFRSPKEQELLSNFADYILAHDIGDVHLHNPEQKTQTGFGMIQAQDAQHLTSMLTSALQDQARINDFLGCMLSQSRHQLNIIVPEEEFDADELMQHIQTEQPLYKVAGLRAVYHEHNPNTLYINGEVFELETGLEPLAQILCDYDDIEPQTLASLTSIPAAMNLLTQLMNKGYWFVE